MGEAVWSDESVLAKVREMVPPAIERHGPACGIARRVLLNGCRADQKYLDFFGADDVSNAALTATRGVEGSHCREA